MVPLIRTVVWLEGLICESTVGRGTCIRPLKALPNLSAVRVTHNINYRLYIAEGERKGESVKTALAYTLGEEQVKNLRGKVCPASLDVLLQSQKQSVMFKTKALLSSLQMLVLLFSSFIRFLGL